MTKLDSQRPEIGIVVTAHNYGRFLEQCIQSVIGQQNAPTWCMVIVDDASSDGTPEILRHYTTDSRIKSLRLTGEGLARASNRGIAEMDTPWVLRLDADDWLMPEALRRLHGHAISFDSDIAYGDLHLVNQQGSDIGVLSQSDDIIGSALERSPVGSGMIYRRDVWQSVGGYDESLYYQEDFDFWLKAVEKFTYTHVPGAYYAYRQHGSSMSTNRSPRACCRAEIKHAAVVRRGLSFGKTLLGVIDTVLVLNDRGGAKAGLLALDGRVLLDHVLDRLSRLDGVGEIQVRTDCPEVQDWAHSRSLGILTPGINTDWLQDVCRKYGPGWDGGSRVAIACSPNFPLMESYRYQEVLDTLLLGSYFRVDSVAPDPYTTLVPKSSGWEDLCGETGQDRLNGRFGKMRMTGGLSAGRIAAETGKRGCVELTWPEDQVVRDEATLKMVAPLWQEAIPAQCPRRRY